VLFGLVLFRAPNWATAKAIFARLFLPHTGTALVGGGALGIMLIVAAGIAHWGPNTFEISHQWRPMATAALSLLFVLSMFLMYGAKISPFLYFQF
jgi:hypothetical protein